MKTPILSRMVPVTFLAAALLGMAASLPVADPSNVVSIEATSPIAEESSMPLRSWFLPRRLANFEKRRVAEFDPSPRGGGRPPKRASALVDGWGGIDHKHLTPPGDPAEPPARHPPRAGRD